MTHGSLFSGIGGFDLAAEWMGWENIFHCEWNPFGQKVLKYHFPNSISYEDITKTDFTVHRGRIDILTGGFPCQPYSMAGKRLGKEDERHLWPEMLRAIREIQPRWVVGENVLGLVNWSGGLVFHEVQADLEAEGYEVQPYVLPACAVNAPHRRDRVWFVAHAVNNRHSARRKEESGQNGLQRVNRQKMGTGKFDGASIPRDVTNPNGIGCGRGSEQSESNKSKERKICENEQQHRNGVWCEVEECSWDASNTNCDGCNQRNGNDEEQPGEGGLDAQRNPLPSNGDGDVADTQQQGFQGCPDSGKVSSAKRKMGRKGNQSTIESAAIGKESNAADTNDKRLERECRSIGELERGFGFVSANTRNMQRPSWDNFPTVSPICNGDDGISNRLDGITFSKWRNESIKAGGNAIVPQVVYQIFKAIEQYETQALPGDFHQ
jgi:DNA (cytosine-5)-methyltransferase 1